MDAIELTQAGLLIEDTSADRILIDSNPDLEVIEFPNLETVAQIIYITNNPVLNTVNMPVLASTAPGSRSGIRVHNNPLLANIILTSFLPANYKQMTFTACGLTQATVDHILARCLASAGFVIGSVNLSGGTSATPGTQGVLDKAALIARGINVITN